MAGDARRPIYPWPLNCSLQQHATTSSFCCSSNPPDLTKLAGTAGSCTSSRSSLAPCTATSLSCALQRQRRQRFTAPVLLGMPPALTACLKRASYLRFIELLNPTVQTSCRFPRAALCHLAAEQLGFSGKSAENLDCHWITAATSRSSARRLCSAVSESHRHELQRKSCKLERSTQLSV